MCRRSYGSPTTIYNPFERWAERGAWEDLFNAVAARGRSAHTQMINYIEFVSGSMTGVLRIPQSMLMPYMSIDVARCCPGCEVTGGRNGLPSDVDQSRSLPCGLLASNANT